MAALRAHPSSTHASPPPSCRGLLLLLAALAGACTGSIGVPNAGTPPPGAGATPPPDPGRPPGTSAPPGTGATRDCAPAPARIWALTPEQWVRTVKSVLPAAAITAEALTGTIAREEGFSNQASRLALTEPHVAQLLELSYQLASDAAADPAALAPCLAESPPAAACVRGFVEGFAGRAFRRDLTAAEVDGLVAQHARTLADGDPRGALRQLLMAVLTAPSLLFRTELGPEGAVPGAVVTLTPFEQASALSFFLTDGPPDAELLAAARAGALATPGQIEAQTRRLLAGPQVAAGLVRFAGELYQAAEVLDADKDLMVFPDWKAALQADLAAEADAFLRQVIWNEDGTLATLLTAPFSMLNTRLAGYYGAAGAAPASGFGKVAFGPGERAGIFTLGALQATLAKDNDSDAVARGRFLRETLLCQNLPEPPVNLAIVPPPPDGKRSMRERLAQHSADPSCATCHALMDPLGLGFEIYDGIGRYRREDLGRPIDASGRLTGAAPEGAAFGDGVELMKLLAGSPDAAACFVRTTFRYGHGREPAAGDACVVDRLAQRFAGSGGQILDLVVAITTDDSFVQRRNP